MTLWLCLRFERLALECLERGEEELVAVVEQRRLVCVSDEAAALGLQPGQGVATARALVGDQPLQLLERDRAREMRCLNWLCSWAYGITPTLHCFQQDCLQLEIGGCLKLFGGLGALLARVRQGLTQRGFDAAAGLAPTPGAAWLLSFTEPARALDTTTGLESRLASIPVALLEPLGQDTASLRRAGLQTLGSLLQLPEQALARRCGEPFRHRLQQILGRAHDAQPDYQPPTTYSDRYLFGYEVRDLEEMLPAIESLLQSLQAFLRNTQRRTRTLRWTLVGVDRQLHELEVRTTDGLNDWRSWYQLTRLRLETRPPAQGTEEIQLVCSELSEETGASEDLFADRGQREPLGRLVDRLTTRLGQQAVSGVACRDEHLPEYAVHAASIEAARSGPPLPESQRPFWLLPEPEPLETGRDSTLHWNGCLQLIYGPERIEDNWWQDPVSRDYFIGENPDGLRYWLFFDRLRQRWFIHGIFA